MSSLDTMRTYKTNPGIQPSIECPENREMKSSTFSENYVKCFLDMMNKRQRLTHTCKPLIELTRNISAWIVISDDEYYLVIF